MVNMSYKELLKWQNLPEISKFFGVSPENFQIRLNSPDSIESKLMAVFMSVVVYKQRAEKLAIDAISLIRQAEESIENYINHRRSAMSNPSKFVEHVEKSEDTKISDAHQTLESLIGFVKAIQLQRDTLVKEHAVQVQKLHDVYIEAVQNVVTKELGFNISNDNIEKNWDFLKARREQKSETIDLDRLQKIGVVLPPPAPPVPKLNQFATKNSNVDEDPYSNIKQRSGVNYDLMSQIVVFGQMARNYVENGPFVMPIARVAPASKGIIQLEKDHEVKLTSLNSVFEATYASMTNVMDKLDNRIDGFRQSLANPLTPSAPAPVRSRVEEDEVLSKKAGPNLFRP